MRTSPSEHLQLNQLMPISTLAALSRTKGDGSTLKVMRRVASERLDSLPRREADFIEPMDCAPVSKLPDGLHWTFEIKLDGYRAIAVKSDRGVDLFSRRHKSFNNQYPKALKGNG